MEEIRFSGFELRRRTRRLTRGGEDVLLGARAFDLLELLITCRDRVVGRENNLNVQVGNLRRLLGSGAIITVPGRGLRFALEVTLDDPAPSRCPISRPSRFFFSPISASMRSTHGWPTRSSKTSRPSFHAFATSSSWRATRPMSIARCPATFAGYRANLASATSSREASGQMPSACGSEHT